MLTACALLWLVGAAAPAGESATAGFEVGDSIGEGWRIDAIRTHPEFLRCTVSRGQTTVEVEIQTAPDPGPGPFRTAHYLVQPAPGSTPSAEVLQAFTDTLARAEQAGGATPRL